MNEPYQHPAKLSINTNTGVSIGIAVLIVGAAIAIINGQSAGREQMVLMKTEILQQSLQTKTELSGQIIDLKNRMTNMEAAKNSWTSTDMFKWAVHLQQSNPSIKVPEPDVNTK